MGRVMSYAQNMRSTPENTLEVEMISLQKHSFYISFDNNIRVRFTR